MVQLKLQNLSFVAMFLRSSDRGFEEPVSLLLLLYRAERNHLHGIVTFIQRGMNELQSQGVDKMI